MAQRESIFWFYSTQKINRIAAEWPQISDGRQIVNEICSTISFFRVSFRTDGTMGIINTPKNYSRPNNGHWNIEIDRKTETNDGTAGETLAHTSTSTDKNWTAKQRKTENRRQKPFLLAHVSDTMRHVRLFVVSTDFFFLFIFFVVEVVFFLFFVFGHRVFWLFSHFWFPMCCGCCGDLMIHNIDRWSFDAASHRNNRHRPPQIYLFRVVSILCLIDQKFVSIFIVLVGRRSQTENGSLMWHFIFISAFLFLYLSILLLHCSGLFIQDTFICVQND